MGRVPPDGVLVVVAVTRHRCVEEEEGLLQGMPPAKGSPKAGEPVDGRVDGGPMTSGSSTGVRGGGECHPWGHR